MYMGFLQSSGLELSAAVLDGGLLVSFWSNNDEYEYIDDTQTDFLGNPLRIKHERTLIRCQELDVERNDPSTILVQCECMR